jgi:hypothetical protein
MMVSKLKCENPKSVRGKRTSRDERTKGRNENRTEHSAPYKHRAIAVRASPDYRTVCRPLSQLSANNRKFNKSIELRKF